MDEQARYEEARKRVEEIRGFYHHLTAYVVVNAVLLVINMLTSPGHYWFFWPLLGWGIGVAIHGLITFGGIRGRSWEERKISEIMEKDARSRGDGT